MSSSALSNGSDGGLLDSIGTTGFVWGTTAIPDDDMLVTGKVQVPGNPAHMSSTGSELCGLLATLTYARFIIDYFDLEPPVSLTVQLYGDSKTALSRFGHSREPPGTSWRYLAHYNLESAVCVS